MAVGRGAGRSRRAQGVRWTPALRARDCGQAPKVTRFSEGAPGQDPTLQKEKMNTNTNPAIGPCGYSFAGTISFLEL